MSDIEVRILTDEKEKAKLNQLMEQLFEAKFDSKLLPCGPVYTFTITKKYNPKYWPKFKGSSHDRRIIRRGYIRGAQTVGWRENGTQHYLPCPTK